MNDDSREEMLRLLAKMGGLSDEALDLADAALLLGALDGAEELFARSRGHVEQLVSRLAEIGAGAETVQAQASALSQVLYEEAGYEGDHVTYDDPANANLLRVIERRRGLPVALGLLYIHLGDKQGWQVRGLAVPGHFVIRISAEGERLVLDPFNGGAKVETPQLRMLLKRAMGPDAELAPAHLVEVGKREVLMRLQNNIKSRALAEKRLDRVACVLERMTLLAPAEASLWYERGLIESEVGHLGAAANALKICVERSGEGALRKSAEAALAKLSRRLN
jgi:regulator of sirC expression with transglutaminase-like and TPR domain